MLANQPTSWESELGTDANWYAWQSKMLVKSANKFDIIRKTILLAFWQPSILVKGHIFLVTVSIYEEENKKKEE